MPQKQILGKILCSVIIIKRGPVIEADKSFSSQLRVMNLSEGNPYEILHSYVANAVSPFFKSYVRVTGKADRCCKTIDLMHVFTIFKTIKY